jgi:hypothetical protein
MKQEAAETFALEALGWLVGNDELLPVFLGATGASRADLVAGAGDAAFLGALLDFVLQNDDWVIALAAALGVDPARVMSARAALPGGATEHWT